MIKLSPYPKIPDTLKSEKVKKALESIENKIINKEIIKSTDFPPLWQADDIKESIWQHHHGKCCYCERKRDKKRESDIEHFRPKAGISGEKNHSGYWWLAYEWENYLFSCKLCNQEYKKNLFPLLPGGVRAENPEDNLEHEKPVLIHPVKDNPEELIGFDWQAGIFVKAVGLDAEGRGQSTINQLTGINNGQVMEERAHLINSLKVIAYKMISAKNDGNSIQINECKKTIENETKPHLSFTGFRRTFFRSMGLEEYIYKGN